MQDWVMFETNERRFKIDDFSFHLVGTLTLPRINQEPVSAQIPGRYPIHFVPQYENEEMELSLAYGGTAYRADIDRLVSALFNSRQPLRMILGFENDRFYVVQVMSLEDEPRLNIAGDVSLQVRLLRNYALRRWRDDEITPDNPDINFSMPIVPVKTEHDLTGSSITIPYYNEGIDLPLVLELSGVDKPTITSGDTVARYSRNIGGKLLIDFEYLKAQENGTDRSGYLSGDPVEIPHGDQLIRLHYQIRPTVAVRAKDELYEDFIQGTPVSNTEVVQLPDNLGAVRGIAVGPGEFISRELDISTPLRPQKAVLSFTQSLGGSVEFDTRLFLDGQWTNWFPVGYDGTVQGITPETDLTGAKIQYRARFNTYPDESGGNPSHYLYSVSIAVEAVRAGKLTIKNRKRFL